MEGVRQPNFIPCAQRAQVLVPALMRRMTAPAGSADDHTGRRSPFSWHSAIALTALLGALYGCGEAPLAVETSRQAIMDGEESVPELDGAMRINVGASTGVVCTGSLVAPNLVITAHHCVAQLDERDGFACTMEGELDTSVGSGGYLGGDVEPETVHVYGGVNPGAEPSATAKQIIAPFSDNICQNDIALLVLDRDVDLPLVPLRLDSPTKVGELMTMVGYGVNETGLASRRQRAGNPVLAVGPSDVNPDQTGSAPRTFMLGPGACTGDSGGPALSDDTGAAVGVFSILGGVCGTDFAHTTYTQIAPFAVWIRDTFNEVGGEPILEEVPEDPDLRRSETGCSVSRHTGPPLSGLWIAAVGGLALMRLRRPRLRTAACPSKTTRR